mmetsp:Transcript_4672/g.13071  ORF Transcript_4672/g.13071 Transcript_4672/m.13071 type:complete len:436 (-) Transcript_4672:224-1531(-)|eukprot:CAMPEP_0119156626 /NCGR_PEP_ID=MMETSP1310-20130426/52350_1 /TAXON_ID=464262 /ORGANISM="Genus nov. species nov., Strain RCC2339" /LENGTH=435 /DNA_ID=CAMNT_0007149241 /DNA_START=69 /DNA_END=1376 /DNA_ORIENTATION=+
MEFGDDDDFGMVDADDDFGAVGAEDEDDGFGTVAGSNSNAEGVEDMDISGGNATGGQGVGSLSEGELEEKKIQLQSLLQALDSSKTAADAINFVGGHIGPNSKYILATLGEALPKVKAQDETKLAVYRGVLELLESNQTEEVANLKRQTVDILEGQSKWEDAAQILESIDVKSRIKTDISEEATAHFTKVASLYLRSGKVAQAAQAINQASPFLPKPSPVGYRDVWASLYAHKHEFQKASYTNLTLVQTCDAGDATPKSALQYLHEAALCAALTPAGPHRLRLLRTICKDERLDSLPFSKLIQEMYKERMIGQHQKTLLRKYLGPHHLTPTRTETASPLERAVIEHNLLSARNIYNNISFEELGLLLGLSPDDAETTAAKMILENRMEGYLDQVKKILYFQEGDEMVALSESIQACCAKVSAVVDCITEAHPTIL